MSDPIHYIGTLPRDPNHPKALCGADLKNAPDIDGAPRARCKACEDILATKLTLTEDQILDMRQDTNYTSRIPSGYPNIPMVKDLTLRELLIIQFLPRTLAETRGLTSMEHMKAAAKRAGGLADDYLDGRAKT